MAEKKQVEVIVPADELHTHNGEACKKGDKIKVSPEVKAMLEKSWAETVKESEGDA